MICGDPGVVACITDTLFRFSEDAKDGEEEEPVSCVKALELLREVARVDKAKKLLVEMYCGAGAGSSAKHVVMGVVFAMTAPRATAEVREAAVCALSNLALVEELRSAFGRKGKRPAEGAKTVTAVHALLAIGRPHKTETPASRAVALGTLMNACIGVKGGDVKKVRGREVARREVTNFSSN